MADAAFSGDGKYYSALTQDGRLRIWDTETNVLKQEYTPDLHLTAPPLCLQWISVTRSVSPQKGGRRKSISDNETQAIALGTTSGKILLYSVEQGKVETVLVDKKNHTNNKVKSLDWHRKYGLLSCTGDNSIQEWELESAKIRHRYKINVDNKNKQTSGVSAIKIIPHSEQSSAKYIVAASWQLRIWRLQDNQAILVKNLGHNASPRALLSLATAGKTCWLIEGSQNERLLSFWDVTITDDPPVNGDEPTPNKRQRKKSITASVVATPTYNFVLEDAPKIIDVNVETDEGGSKLQLAAATRSGVVHYYEHMLNGASTKPIKPSVTVQVTTGDATPLPLQCCCLTNTGDLLLGYTNTTIWTFERLTPDLSTKTQVLIRGDTKDKKKQKHTNEVNKVRADSKKDDVKYVEPMGGVTRKRTTPGGQVEVSMEARLANLALDVKSRGKSAVNQNLTKLLMQGLHSKDKNIILTVLQRDEAGVAWRTAAHLPADYVPLLLDQLADMATRRTSQCAAVCTWLGATLRAHAALLLATTPPRLTQLLAILTHRRSHLCQLLNLKGRLELATTQRSAEEEDIDQEPVLRYDDSSSGEEMEAQYQSDDSAPSWEEGEGEDGEAGGGHSDSEESD
ncbi:WD repeat-containing protein 43 [Papilio xuthus]|uniref:WD repeat-containing protein 43 n=1 Tax=Papilio xuthus TaxID=66420 RepID=A0A0N0P9N1_PAPXU|nr:WD repeat-containing protein 43 [Papilio xuthus]